MCSYYCFRKNKKTAAVRENRRGFKPLVAWWRAWPELKSAFVFELRPCAFRGGHFWRGRSHSRAKRHVQCLQITKSICFRNWSTTTLCFPPNRKKKLCKFWSKTLLRKQRQKVPPPFFHEYEYFISAHRIIFATSYLIIKPGGGALSLFMVSHLVCPYFFGQEQLLSRPPYPSRIATFFIII